MALVRTAPALWYLPGFCLRSATTRALTYSGMGRNSNDSAMETKSLGLQCGLQACYDLPAPPRTSRGPPGGPHASRGLPAPAHAAP